MNNWIYYYQHLPYYFDPVALKLGPFSISWYALMYLVAFLVVYKLLVYRLEREEWNKQIKNQNATRLPARQECKTTIQNFPPKADPPMAEKLDKNLLQNILWYSFIGLIVGARLGYVLFYNFNYYWENPLAIISPFDPVSGEFRGIYGMSYHGGVIGVIISSLLFIQRHNLNFWALADFVVPVIPAGYFFGRIGNFINSELYGRVTSNPWGMYFPTDIYGFLRHPSQIYEALGEGLLLFLILWFLRNNRKIQGNILIIYISGYAVIRFLIEFFRESDAPIGLVWGILTMGQILSLVMVLAAVIIYLLRTRISAKIT